MALLRLRDLNQQQSSVIGKEKSGLSVQAPIPSIHRIACPGCRTPLDSIDAVPSHISSGSCPVFKSLPQWFLDAQAVVGHQHQREEQRPPLSNSDAVTPAPNRQQHHPFDDASTAKRNLGFGASPSVSSSSSSPFLLRRQQGHSIHAEPISSVHSCAVCSTTGHWYPSAPARSTVRLLSSSSCGHALCNNCIGGMFRCALKIKSLQPLDCPVEECGSGHRRHDDNSNDDDDDDDDDAAASVALASLPVSSNRRGHVTESDTVGIITTAEWEQLHSAVMSTFVDEQVAAGNFIKCPNCDFVAEACYDSNNNGDDDDQQQQKSKDEGGLTIFEGVTHTAEAAETYRQRRMRCLQCSVTFCSRCFTTPFHLGMTCETHRRHEEGGSCRFCQNPVEEMVAENDGDDDDDSRRGKLLPRDVCSNAECVERGLLCCPSLLDCGHPCYFSRSSSHQEHHICLVPDCPSRNSMSNSVPTRDDWCTICYTETLAAGPVVRLSGCSHIFHLDCARQKIAAKWPGPRITFGFLGCANCKQEMEAPELKPQLEGVLSLRRSLRGMMMERLVHEGLDKRPEVVNADIKSVYYQKPELYAEHVFAFYPCYKCGAPFYGGHNRCADGVEGANDNNNNNNENDDDAENRGGGNNNFDPKELLCSKCIPDGQKRSCRVHGSTFITFKCKFCCSVAAFFCWGSTHFCAACHRVQESGTYLNKLPVSELPVCPGKERCPLGVDHPPNGVAEFPLGCALCQTPAAASSGGSL